MRIIEQLHNFITPKVLELVKNHSGDDTSKTNLLSSLYGILGARLSDPQAVNRLEALSDDEKDSPKILDVLLQDEHGNSQAPLLTKELANEHNLSPETVAATVGVATPLVYTQFKNLAEGNSVAVYLQDKLTDFADYLPSWAVALLPAGLLAGIAGLAGSAVSGVGSLAGKAVSGVSGAVSGVADSAKAATGAVVSGAKDLAGSAATHVNDQVVPTKKSENNFLKTLLPIIGLIIFAGLVWLLLRGCQDNKTPVASPVANNDTSSASATASTSAANATPATFSMATDQTGNAIYSCRSQAGGQGVFASIRTALSGVFGVADKCEMDIVNGYADTLPASEHLPALLGLLKGVPNSSITINDKTIRFNAADDAAVAKLIEGAKAVVPTDFTVEAEPKLDAQTAVANSIDTAKSAIENLTDTADADALVHALNLQIINFATASSAIPDENKAVLDLAAEKLIKMPNAHLKITGHTDDKGNYKSNKTLSQKRAAAVHDYLVSKGVPDAQLETFGASSDEPVASNATEQGRFQNRRIEFTLIQADGSVTAVGNAQNSQAAATSNQATSTPETASAASN